MIIVPRVILSSSSLVFKVIVYIAVALHLHCFICCCTWGHSCSLQKWSLSSNRWVGKEISGMWCYLKMMQLLNQLWDSLRVLISERRDASWIIFFSLRVNDAGLSDLLSHFGWLELRALSISQEVLCLAELGHWLKIMMVVGNPARFYCLSLNPFQGGEGLAAVLLK